MGGLSSLIGGILCVVGYRLSRLVGEVVPDPYLDEVFHVPQTQRFCNLSSQWDPKITTLPGSYLLVASVLKPLELLEVVGEGAACSVQNLRSVNFLIGALLNFGLISEIVKHYMKGQPEWKIVISTVNVSLFPVLYFFNFMYYTDVVSTFWFLLMHLMYLKKYYGLSAVSGGFSIVTRQTNVVWVAFHAMIIGLEAVEAAYKDVYLKRIVRRKGPKSQKQPRNKQKGEFNYKKVVEIIEKAMERLLDKFHQLFGYALSIIGFLIFVIWNGGIVVGDKTAHVASINLPQMGYFTLVYGFFCAPFLCFRLPSMLPFIKKNLIAFSCAVSIFGLAAHFNTVAHPYLLADNRHYPFYLWRKVYQTIPSARFLLCPVYVIIWGFIIKTLKETLSGKYAFALILCSFIQLVPQLLLEFRYFIPIYLLARFAIPKPTAFEVLLETGISLLVNMVTFYLFLYKPFQWPNEDGLQRFMW